LEQPRPGQTFKKTSIICAMQLQVLIDDSARLQEAYPGGNAEHIASQQAMVVDNWDILQQKSAQRKSDLQATMDLYWFLNAVRSSCSFSGMYNLKFNL